MKTIGVILAGGASSRMGQDKAMLSIEQSTMLTRTQNVLAGTSVDKIIISRNDQKKGHFADLIPNKGPLSGIHSAAVRFPFFNLLILPVDLPLMDSTSLQPLIDQGLASNKNVRFGKHSLPLFIRNTAALRETLDYTLRCTNCYSVNRLCSHFGLMELKPNKQSSLYNTNTPDQWRFAMQHFELPLHTNDTEAHHESFK